MSKCIDKELLELQILRLMEDTHKTDPCKDTSLAYKILGMVVNSTTVCEVDLFKVRLKRKQIAAEVCNTLKQKISTKTNEGFYVCSPDNKSFLQLIIEVEENFV